MIAHLRGRLLSKHPNQAIVEAAGVGYDAADLRNCYGLGETLGREDTRGGEQENCQRKSPRCKANSNQRLTPFVVSTIALCIENVKV